jgi:hypothetical protein
VKKKGRPARFVLQLEGGELPLRAGTWVVGRAEDARVQLEDESVSRRHAMLRVSKAQVDLLDLGSQNGTYLNGERLAKPATLASGDWITFGVVEVRFEERAGAVALEESDTPATKPISAAAAMARARADRARMESAAPPAAAPAVPLLLVLRDRAWAEQIQRASEVGGELRVEHVKAADVAAAAARVAGSGALLLDLGEIQAAPGIVAAWRGSPPRRGRIVLVSADMPEHTGRAEAVGLGAQNFVRAGKPAILVVAAVRFHLEVDSA